MFGAKGLIKANIGSYFKAMSKGLSEDEALNWVINSRYPISKSNRDVVRIKFESFNRYSDKKIKNLVLAILFFEYPRAEYKYNSFEFSPFKTSFTQEIDYQINSIYESMRKKYRVS